MTDDLDTRFAAFRAACEAQPDTDCSGWGQPDPDDINVRWWLAVAAGSVLLGLCIGVLAGAWH